MDINKTIVILLEDTIKKLKQQSLLLGNRT